MSTDVPILEDDIGVRESAILTDMLSKKVERAFAAKGAKAERVDCEALDWSENG